MLKGVNTEHKTITLKNHYKLQIKTCNINYQHKLIVKQELKIYANIYNE